MTEEHQSAPQHAGNNTGGGEGASPQNTSAGATDGSGTLPKRSKRLFVIPPHPNTEFDEEYFLDLLEGSISLTLEEKQRVIDAIPNLSIEQINELIKIFEEERQKFAELEKEFAEDVERLKRERERELELAEIREEEKSEEEQAKAEAEEIKKQLGL